jgi:uncharacterized protein with HEPN domain
MSNEEKKFLADILHSIQNIDIHLQHKRNFVLFEGNVTIRSAVKYEFSIIGEAVYELLKLNKDLPLTDARKIISFRNKMVHEYDVIDNAQVWNIVINYLPKLETEVKDLLA